MSNNLELNYFNWMYSLVCKKRGYRKLMTKLYSTRFRYSLEMDENRYDDGIDLRYRFAYECGYSNEEIEEAIGAKPCMVLEMMVSLALRCEEAIMYDPEEGDRTDIWFWDMIVSLGLDMMDDQHYQSREIDAVLARFLDHKYALNGEGSLFTLPFEIDIHETDIWKQMCMYLNTIE